MRNRCSAYTARVQLQHSRPLAGYWSQGEHAKVAEDDDGFDLDDDSDAEDEDPPVLHTIKVPLPPSSPNLPIYLRFRRSASLDSGM